MDHMQPVVRLQRLQLPANICSRRSFGSKKRKQSSSDEENVTHFSKKTKKNSLRESDCSSGRNLPFVCLLCEDGKFSLRKDLIDHTLLHTDTNTDTCLTCKKSFNKRHQLREHMMSKHTVDKNLTCEVCKKEFSYPHCRKSHMQCHDTTRTGFDCEICGKKYIKKISLRVHQAEHANWRRFPCSLCQCSFGNEYNLLAHMKTHDGFCKGTFESNKRLESNMLTYTGGRSFSCFKNTSNKKSFKCDNCGKGFVSSSNLYRHIRLLHHQGKVYPGVVCNKMFSNTQHQADHLVIHAEEKAFSCSVCGKRFHRKGEVKCHMKTHSDLKPYCCALCDGRFKRHTTLKDHMLTHTEEKPYTCVLCDKSFNRTVNLNAHMLIHTGEKPHSCPVCGTSFRYRYKMRLHIGTVHKDTGLTECDQVPREEK